MSNPLRKSTLPIFKPCSYLLFIKVLVRNGKFAAYVLSGNWISKLSDIRICEK